MACISINTPDFLTNAQGSLSQVTDAMAALSGESCNVFGALGLDGVESGIQDILGKVGSAMSAVNDAIAQVQNVLNSVVDTALSAVNQILENITGAINQVANIAQQAIGSVTGFIDEAIGALAERAKISEILSCAGTLGQIGLLPGNVTEKLDQISSFLSSDTPVKDIANNMISGIKDDLTGRIQEAVGGFVTNIGDTVNSAQDLINVNIGQLSSFSCAS